MVVAAASPTVPVASWEEAASAVCVVAGSVSPPPVATAQAGRPAALAATSSRLRGAMIRLCSEAATPPSAPVARSVKARGSVVTGTSNSVANCPRASAVASATTSPAITISTLALGALRPATVRTPSPVIRIVSNCGVRSARALARGTSEASVPSVCWPTSDAAISETGASEALISEAGRSAAGASATPPVSAPFTAASPACGAAAVLALSVWVLWGAAPSDAAALDAAVSDVTASGSVRNENPP